MVDYAKLQIKAGKGGDGAVSFQTLRGRPKGPPDGGDGGDGGSAYLIVDKDLTTLVPYRFKKNFHAGDGKRGAENHKTGSRGEDLFLPVPRGTKVVDAQGRFFADLTTVGDKVMVTRGGLGGRGNMHVKRSDFKAKSSELVDKKEMWAWHEEGEKGQEITLTLELKLLADVGIIGLPNAGKSTLLSVLTAAKPKIANYPFTTLEPNIGVLRHKVKELILADIPGLIEGASQGKGLGEAFLRHIERTQILLHLVSAEVENPAQAVRTVNNELLQYSKDLLDKPQIIVLSKIDTLTESELKQKIKLLRKPKVLTISALTKEGLEKLKDELISLF